MSVIVVTGIQGAGKSTVAKALAERLTPSVHVPGDVFRRMVVRGRVDMGSADPPSEALRQLELRYELASLAADRYSSAGFQVVLQDVILGRYVTETVKRIRARPLYLVVLAPRVDVVEARDAARRAARGKVAYKPGDQGVAELDRVLRRETPPAGLWLDSSNQTVDETVEEILARLRSDALVAS
jgi:chloramphenicol 3-O-phosphotransferase